MSLRRTVIGIFSCLLPMLVVAGPSPTVKAVQVLPDRAALMSYLRARGYQVRGGIDRASTDHNEGQGRSFPYFASSFTVGGTTYPFTMVGYPPQSGRSASIETVIIPLRLNFVGFGPNQDISVSFDPAPAVANMIASPLYVPASWPGGFSGQFGDAMQRAAFWNRMDANHNWHVRLAGPRVLPTIDIEVTPETGALFQINSDLVGSALIDFIDAEARTILQFLDLEADTLPIFVTGDSIAEALGYHTAYPVATENGTRLQTFIYTSWLNPALVDPLLADVSTFNHELAEWLNDPFTNNVTPDWFYPPPTDPTTVCSGNPSLEVGDPQGNGPTFADFPTAAVTLSGVTYHLQQLVLWQWFADEVPSSAFGGWYTFPIPSSLTVPAVYCP